MPVTYIPPVGGGGGGGLMNAFQLWNKFAGPESKQNAANLALTQAQIDASKQGLTNAAQEHDIREEVRGPNLATANATAARLQTELGKVTNDEATRSGSVEALNNAPLNLWKPTDQFTPDEFQNWKDLHAKYGARDLNGAATAWNKSMANIRSQHPQPAGAIPSQYTTQNGETAVSGYVLPNLSAIPGLPTPQPAAQPAPSSAAPSATPAPAVAPPAGAAPAPSASSSSTLPDIDPRLLAVPAFRQMYEAQLAIKEKGLAMQEKQQQIEKGSRDVAYGTPEERKAEGEFIRNAAQMSHRLTELQGVVEKSGNFGWNSEASAKLKSLPLDMSDNWTKITNPGGVLREGLVHLNKELQIPIAPQNPAGFISPTRPFNSTTLAAVEQTKKVLADYIRQYENLPTTKQPVIGLTPELRKLVGPTRFGKPEEIPSESPQESGGALASRVFTSQAEAMQRVPMNEPYVVVDPATGKTLKFTRGKEGQAAQPSSNTNSIPAGIPLLPSNIINMLPMMGH